MTGGSGRRLRGARLPVLLGLMVLSGAGGAQAWGQEGLDDIRIKDPRISESSGLSVSPATDELLYTVNDSGHDPVVFVVERPGGEVVGTTMLEGLDPDAIDPEAMAVQGDRLWVADTGDNSHERDDVALYSLPAPGRGDHTVRPSAYPLRYAEGNPDVEALLMPPDGTGGWLVTKDVFGGEVLALPAQMKPGEPVEPTPVPDVEVPGLVTDATMLPRHDGAVVRLYGKALVYRLPDWTQVATLDLPGQEQGESITALPDGRTLLAGSEGSPALIDAVTVPTKVLADLEPAGTDGAGEPTSTSTPSTDAGEAADDLPLAVAGGVAAVVVLGGGALLARRYAARRRVDDYY